MITDIDHGRHKYLDPTKDPDLIIIPSNNEPSARMLKIVCEKLYPNTLTVIVLDRNREGKGFSIRRALTEITDENIVVFLDGDFDISPIYIVKLMKYIDDCDIVVAEKDLSDVPIQRKIISLGYRLLIKLLFNLNVNDTQTGLKIWKRHAIPEFDTDGFAFDVEMLAKAHKKGRRIKSVPIQVNIDKKVRIGQIWNTLKETLKVWLVLLSQDIMKI